MAWPARRNLLLSAALSRWPRGAPDRARSSNSTNVIATSTCPSLAVRMGAPASRSWTAAGVTGALAGGVNDVTLKTKLPKIEADTVLPPRARRKLKNVARPSKVWRIFWRASRRDSGKKQKSRQGSRVPQHTVEEKAAQNLPKSRHHKTNRTNRNHRDATGSYLITSQLNWKRYE